MKSAKKLPLKGRYLKKATISTLCNSLAEYITKAHNIEFHVHAETKIKNVYAPRSPSHLPIAEEKGYDFIISAETDSSTYWIATEALSEGMDIKELADRMYLKGLVRKVSEARDLRRDFATFIGGMSNEELRNRHKEYMAVLQQVEKLYEKKGELSHELVRAVVEIEPRGDFMTSYTPATYWEPAECDFVEFSAAIVGVDEKGKSIEIELPQDLTGVVADPSYVHEEHARMQRDWHDDAEASRADYLISAMED